MPASQNVYLCVTLSTVAVQRTKFVNPRRYNVSEPHVTGWLTVSHNVGRTPQSVRRERNAQKMGSARELTQVSQKDNFSVNTAFSVVHKSWWRRC